MVSYSPSMGGFWIGKPGSLLQLPGWVGELDVKHNSGVSFATAASGRSFAFVSGERPARAWSVTIPYLTPEQVGTLQALMAEPVPEYMWLSVEAATSNALTPEASLGGTANQRVGVMPRDDGSVAPVAISNPGAATGDAPVVVGAAPVVPGAIVTGSAWMAGRLGPYMLLQFLDAEQNVITATGSARAATTLGVLHRASVTATAPVGAVAVNVAPMSAEYYAQCALSWTAHPVEWAYGGLCLKAVPHGLSESIRRSRVDADPMGRLRDISFTMTEVG